MASEALRKAKEQQKIEMMKIRTEREKIKNESRRARVQARAKNGGVGGSVILYDKSGLGKSR